MNTWDVFTGWPSPAPGMLVQLGRLRAALPGYEVIITSHAGSYRFEAIRRPDGIGPWCVISSDPADLWHELLPGQPSLAVAPSRERVVALNGPPRRTRTS